MTYREKSVSINEEAEHIFKSVLGDIVVNEKGIRRRELKSQEDWERIEATMEPEEIFTGFLPWRKVVEVSKKDDFLSYPHIDITVAEEEEGDRILPKRLKIFMKEDTPDNYDETESCFKTIKRMWDAYRQNNKLHTLNYSYNEEQGVEKLEAEEKAEKVEKPPEEEQHEKEAEGEQDEDEPDSVQDVINQAMEDPGELMDRFGS